MKQVRQITAEEQIKAIIEVSNRIGQSKEAINKFLEDAGILNLIRSEEEKTRDKSNKK